LEPPRSKTKILTKAAVAKKILKKKIQANQVLIKKSFKCFDLYRLIFLIAIRSEIGV